MIRDWILAALLPLSQACGSVEQVRLGGRSTDSDLLSVGDYYSDLDGGLCAYAKYRAEAVPLDLFILLDRSGSMSGPINTGTKWSMIGEALSTFVNDPASAGIQVALTYFSQPVAGQLVPNDDLYSCLVSDYVRPAVTMDVLPVNAQPIVDSIRAHEPSGPTPTNIALVGAINYLHDWAKVHPTHHLAIVLATDGEPKGCNATTDNTAGLAAGALAGTPSIATYVIGVGGGLEILQPIAAGGGTSKPFLINNVVNATQDFIDAMYAVRVGQGLPCAYAIPRPTGSDAVDAERVNVDFTEPTSGKPNLVPFFQVASAEQCSAVGPTWYYDDPTNPHEIRLCGQICQDIRHVTSGELSITVGCKTRVIIN